MQPDRLTRVGGVLCSVVRLHSASRSVEWLPSKIGDGLTPQVTPEIAPPDVAVPARWGSLGRSNFQGIINQCAYHSQYSNIAVK